MIEIPISGDRLKNARVEISMLSDDALVYLLGLAVISINEAVDGEQSPDAKKELLLLTECLQGPSPVMPSHVPPEMMQKALHILSSLLDHVPNRHQPTWAQ